MSNENRLYQYQHRQTSAVASVLRGILQRFVYSLLRTIMANNANVQAVLSALDVFSRAPEKAALEQANTWLQDFQHSVNTRFAWYFGTPRGLTHRFQPLPSLKPGQHVISFSFLRMRHRRRSCSLHKHSGRRCVPPVYHVRMLRQTTQSFDRLLMILGK